MEKNEETKSRIINKFIEECINVLKTEILPKKGIGSTSIKLKSILDSYLEEW